MIIQLLTRSVVTVRTTATVVKTEVQANDSNLAEISAAVGVSILALIVVAVLISVGMWRARIWDDDDSSLSS